MGIVSHKSLAEAIAQERRYRAAELSLEAFTEQAWHVIEPTTKYQSNWHIWAICDHLEAVTKGEIQNIVINMPPGCMKSILVSVMWPAWMWIADPSLRILNASYGEALSVRDAQKSRDIITSEWYQARWPHVQIAKGQDQKVKYALTASGWRMATSVGGRATGEHPSIKVVDDAHSAAQAHSDAERQTALNWFDQTLSTRGASQGAKTVVVMQRLNQNDLSGHIIDNLGGTYEHLFLPMRYEAGTRKKATCLGFEDPRTVEGSLLWPELFPEHVVTQLERNLGEYGAAGQFQQRPSPAGGGILRVSHFQKWPSDKELPAFEAVISSWDTAFTERSTGDPSAMTVWGFFKEGGKKCMFLLDAFAGNLGYPALKQKVLDEWKSEYGDTKRRADFILVEQKASGQSIIQDMRVAGLPVRPYNPGRADKLTRGHMAAPMLETDIVYIPESKKQPGQFVTWAKDFVKECEMFPNGTHDDLVDTFTQVTIYARDANLIASLENEEDEDEVTVDYARKTNGNPYTR